MGSEICSLGITANSHKPAQMKSAITWGDWEGEPELWTMDLVT